MPKNQIEFPPGIYNVVQIDTGVYWCRYEAWEGGFSFMGKGLTSYEAIVDCITCGGWFDPPKQYGINKQ